MDFAFLTKDKISPLGLEEFSRRNAMLSERLFSIASFSSVRKIVTVSSGAAILSTQFTENGMVIVMEGKSPQRGWSLGISDHGQRRSYRCPSLEPKREHLQVPYD